MEQQEIGIDVESGDVVVELTAKPTKDESYEWTYKFRRRYSYKGEGGMAWFFRESNNMDVSNALVKAINYMAENSAADFAKNFFRDQAA